MSQLIAAAVEASLTRSSWIRQMFEEGARLKAQYGEAQVFDFSLGNPSAPPPAAVDAALQSVLREAGPGLHRYLPNAGLPEARAHVAGELAAATGLAYGAEHVVMTCGAAGALNIVLKAVLDPGDEVIALAPYFVEYGFYAQNHGGTLVTVPTDESFQPDAEALRAAITPRTRAVIVNSPNNPTGVVYPAARLRALAEVLREASARHGRPIYLLSDEPYRYLVFDEVEVPWISTLYEHALILTSYSKDLGLAGERLGYVAVSPRIAGHAQLMDALVLANRVLGFVNAPALVQRILPLLHGARVDAAFYKDLRDRMLGPLRAMGYEVVQPDGAFYLFPRSPIADDVAFVRLAQQERLLLVPGSGFGRAGHFRIALCVPGEVIDRALPVFERVLQRARAGGA